MFAFPFFPFLSSSLWQMLHDCKYEAQRFGWIEENPSSKEEGSGLYHYIKEGEVCRCRFEGGSNWVSSLGHGWDHLGDYYSAALAGYNLVVDHSTIILQHPKWGAPGKLAWFRVPPRQNLRGCDLLRLEGCSGGHREDPTPYRVGENQRNKLSWLEEELGDHYASSIFLVNSYFLPISPIFPNVRLLV